MRAYVKDDDLNFIDVLKRVIISNIKFLFKFPITPKRILNATAIWMEEVYQITIRQSRRRPLEDYSESTQEIIRVLSKLNTHKDDFWIKYIVDIWETDQAYRNRGQDALQELNKQNLEKNPRKEVLRLFDLVESREIIGGQKPKMAFLRKILWIMLWFPRIKKIAKEFLDELNLSRINVSIEDRYWMANKWDYNYEGKTFDERMAWKEKEDESYVEPETLPERPQIAVNPPNKAFYALNSQEARKMCEGLAKVMMDNWKENQ